MGLGGLTRDSIVGLDRLVHHDDDDDDDDDYIVDKRRQQPVRPSGLARRRHTDGLGGSWNSGSDGRRRDDTMAAAAAVVADDEYAELSSSCESVFETSLNDGPGGGGTSAVGVDGGATTSLPSSSSSTTTTTTTTTNIAPSAAVAVAVAVPCYPGVSATNTRSLDSYKSPRTGGTTSRYDASSSSTPAGNNDNRGNGGGGGGGSMSTLYQGFQYEGYADYYNDDLYGDGSFDSYDVGGVRNDDDDDDDDGQRACFCLFAPFVAARRRKDDNNGNNALLSTVADGAISNDIGGVEGDAAASTTTTTTTTTGSRVASSSDDVDDDDEGVSAVVVGGTAATSIATPCPSDPPSPVTMTTAMTTSTTMTTTYPAVDSIVDRSATESPSPVKLFGDGTPLYTKPEASPDAADDDDAPCMPILHAADATMEDPSSSSTSDGIVVVAISKKSAYASSSTYAGHEGKEEEVGGEGGIKNSSNRRCGEGDEGDGGGIDGNGVPTAPIKGILKVRRCSAATLNGATTANMNVTGTKAGGGAGSGRAANAPSPTGRKIFPTYEPRVSSSSSSSKVGDDSRGDRSVRFNPMARVLTIPSRRDVPLYQRAQVWWQKSDYEEFKKTGRIISKAMECGGSEIWLTSSNAWGNRAARVGAGGGRAMTDRSSSDVPDDDGRAKTNMGGENDGEDGGNKWWCKFGHSRRGLEHVVSSAEGKARQESVQLATRMVLEEQRRQRTSRTKDPNKLRNVALQYTSWARDLSLANGYADAMAVSSNFDATPWDGCRARHFAKRMNVAGGGGGAVGSTIAALLKSAGDDDDDDVAVRGARVVSTVVTSQMLDANTHNAVAPPVPPRTAVAMSTPMTTATSRAKSLTLTRVDSDGSDQDHSSEGISLKKRAKGFMPGSSEDEVSMMGMNSMGYRSVKVAW
ncbi:hypothetical protein ACHAXA_000197 [Cyclostephanos tholiformis]|uniref:Uncharacterized protein n=1 Tax=Cyclostephanos tholiformis TaxID=382380 RepID=A0ABD3RVL8_9STRA